MSQVKVWFFAAVGGALTGLISFAFLESLDWATRTRLAHGWLVWLLPLAGLAVGAAYHYWGGRAKGGTPSVIEQTHTFTHGVTSRMAPLIFGGSVVGHVFGASVGREGAALQMAGSVSDTAARLGGLDATDRRTIITSSMAGGWGAVFGVPITGVVFAMQVSKKHRLRAQRKVAGYSLAVGVVNVQISVLQPGVVRVIAQGDHLAVAVQAWDQRAQPGQFQHQGLAGRAGGPAV